ncbi:MAG: T9SS type A sorting domain-containing protein [Bacteroidota bacterium]|nr:T9SS type A sorting domain-containing protein [Bacteroidota bacterium]
MKKIYTLIASMLLVGGAVQAQDTLMFEDFNYTTNTILDLGTDPSSLVNTTDTNFYVLDGDGFADANARPGGWYLALAVATADLYTGLGDTNVVLASSSWFGTPGVASNFFITQSVMLGAADTLFWKSAPRQTPRYLDGYRVLLSNTDNSDASFTNVLYTVAEMTGILGTNDSAFSGYSFSSGYVHGLDGTFTEYAADSARLLGELRTFSVPLTAYANQNVFIAFHHNSDDDNLITIDDIMIRGTMPNSINENQFDLGLNVFPNPAVDNAQINYVISEETSVTITVSDITGKVISSESKGAQPKGRHFAFVNTSELANGFYTVTVQTAQGSSTAKLMVK